MKILKLKLFQETACYKKPFAYKVAETYPLPPYSTIIGMFHKILQAQNGEYFPMEVSVQGEYESIFSNYQTLLMYKKNKITSMPRNVHQLLNVNLIIHVRAEDDVIDKIYYNIINGIESFSLGRNEDMVRVDQIKICEKTKQVEEKTLKHNAYIPDTEENEEIHGIKYRLPTTYTIQNDLRVWNKTNVKYVEKNRYVIENALEDEDGDLIIFFNQNDMR